MLQTLSSSSFYQSQNAQYVIYAYLQDDDEKKQESWKRIQTGSDPIKMKEIASDLFQSQDYKKIEIQKKYFDKRDGSQRVKTYCIFENKRQTDYFILFSVLLLSVASAGLFYLKMM